MIVALDLTSAPAGELTGPTVDLVTCLVRAGSPAGRLVLLGREEHRLPLRHATHGLATVLALDPPEPDRRQVDEYRRRKLQLLADHRVDLLHVADGPLDSSAPGLPIVWSADGLAHRAEPGRFTDGERGHRETWYTASAFWADAVIVPGESVRADLHHQLGTGADKMFVCPAAADGLARAVSAAYAHATRLRTSRKVA